jgi:preprotein translocase subunit SecD
MSSGSNVTFAIHLRFTDAKAAELRKFTQEHINHQVQLLAESNVIAEPFIAAEISNSQVDLSFASSSEAHAVANLLAPTFYENYGFNKLDVHGKAEILVNP